MDAREATRRNPSAAQVSAVIDVWQEAGLRKWLPVTGTSMWPMIAPGDEVLVQLGCTPICRGDLVVFRREQDLIAHRVIRSDEGNSVVTKGDNRILADPPLIRKEIVGRIIAIRNGQHVRHLDTCGLCRRGKAVAMVSELQDRIPAYGRRSATLLRIRQPIPGAGFALALVRFASSVSTQLLMGRPRRTAR